MSLNSTIPASGAELLAQFRSARTGVALHAALKCPSPGIRSADSGPHGAGWTLDGMDSFIYALVLGASHGRTASRFAGIAATPADTGYYGGILFALFLVGWGFAFLWGPIADRFGRVRTLMLTILIYSLFTFLGVAWPRTSGNSRRFRFLAGMGIGGEVDSGWGAGGGRVAGGAS